MKKAFKVLTLVCFVAALFTMTSCTKSQEDLIVGTWKITKVDSEPVNPFVGFLGTTLTFNADNTMSTSQEMLGEVETTNGTYKINNGKIVMTIDGDPQDAEIKTLDKKNLVLYLEEIDEEDPQFSIKMTWTLERQ